mmetsp:Transcript_37629/g.104735  ORF Transcript_37629/g.104735 Transcript_37629/m.104735 type:complete len:222 (+) Transcript_37629:429-1094(+)
MTSTPVGAAMTSPASGRCRCRQCGAPCRAGRTTTWTPWCETASWWIAWTRTSAQMAWERRTCCLTRCGKTPWRTGTDISRRLRPSSATATSWTTWCISSVTSRTARSPPRPGLPCRLGRNGLQASRRRAPIEAWRQNRGATSRASQPLRGLAMRTSPGSGARWRRLARHVCQAWRHASPAWRHGWCRRSPGGRTRRTSSGMRRRGRPGTPRLHAQERWPSG